MTTPDLTRVTPQTQPAPLRAAPVSPVVDRRRITSIVAPVPSPGQGGAVGPTEGATHDQDVTGGLRWYLQIDPGSGVVQQGTVLRFRLRNDQGRRGAFSQSPTVTVRIGQRIATIRLQGPPRNHPFLEDDGWVGHLKADVSGTAHVVVEAAPARLPLGTPQPPLRLTATLDVVQEPTAEALSEGSAVERDEQERLNDRDASPGAIGQAFRRLATRRAIGNVNSNLAELESMEERFRVPSSMVASWAEVREAADVDARLEKHRDDRVLALAALRERAHVAQQLRPEHGTDPALEARAATAEAAVDDADAALEAIDDARALLVEAVPAFGVLRHAGKREAVGAPEDATGVMVLLEALDALQADCRRARSALAEGRLDVLRSDPLVAQLRQELGVDADARRSAAIDAMLQQHRADAFEDLVGLMGFSLLLLLVPGVGGYLALAVGGVSATAAWRYAADVQAAVGAGVMTEPEAEQATLDAVLETVLLGLDIPLGLKALKHVKVPQARRTGRISAGRTPAKRRRRRAHRPSPVEGDVIRYGDDAPGLEKHELLQNMWLTVQGHVSKRLVGEISRGNPVIALSPEVHRIVNRYQRALGLYSKAKMTRWDHRKVLALNALALHHAGVEQEVIDAILDEALAHAVFRLGHSL